MANEEKLDWIYKGPNSLVDREDYLLGRKIDKSLEQLNDDENSRKIVLPTPKNHVEHECIPPSIRDFNSIVKAEQIDLSAKLQEDPLVAIKKREEEARRQFLQNPIQLKKLQDALAKQETLKTKNKKSNNKRSSKDLDEQIRAKLKLLKSADGKKEGKKDKDNALTTILMHKYNALKEKLSEEDLQDILNGKTSESGSEEEKPKRRKRSSSGSKSDSKAKRSKHRSVKDKSFIKRASSTEDSSSDNARKKSHKRSAERRRRSRSRSTSKKSYEKQRPQEATPKGKQNQQKESKAQLKIQNSSSSSYKDKELDSKIMSQLKALRGQFESKHKSDKSPRKIDKRMLPEKPAHLRSRSSSTSSSLSTDDSTDSEDKKHKKKSFGLVSSDGKKIDFKKQPGPQSVSQQQTVKKVEAVSKLEKKNVKRLTEEEKEKIRKEMMQNAKLRDKERETNIKQFRAKQKREEENAIPKNYDPELVHNQLMKTAKHTSVEDRIRSNLNKIQRSSRHMDQNFSKR